MDKNFYLFRHALATKSARGYGRKILTAEILAEGIPSIKNLAEYLKNIHDSIYFSSDVLRCRQTTEIIIRYIHKKPIYDKRLNEFYRETFTSFKERVKEFLREISKSRSKNIFICTHGIVIASFKHFLLENKFTFNNRHDFPKVGELLIIKNNSVKKIEFGS